MSTTNLHSAKHINGSPVTEGEIKEGLRIMAPSMTGGTMEYSCVSVTAEKAVFEPVLKEWSKFGIEMVFDVPDFSLADFVAFEIAIKAIKMQGCKAPLKARVLVERAKALGYAWERNVEQGLTTAGKMRLDTLA